MANLSFLMYDLHNEVASCNDTLNDALTMVSNATCLLYSHDQAEGTQVLVVHSTVQRWIAVVYAGTDDWRTALDDGDIVMSLFGDEDEDGDWMGSVPPGVKIHRGFNNAVFANGGLDRVLDAVKPWMEGEGDETYRCITAGHSLGAADSVIAAVALHLRFPGRVFTTINFGCPKVGNYAWSQWLRSLGTLEFRNRNETSDIVIDDGRGGVDVYRFVNGRDLVPRLPAYPFYHAGHTIQIENGALLAYYHHSGEEDLGYAGVPLTWSLSSLVWPVGAFVAHRKSYIRHLNELRPEVDESYFRDFVSVGDEEEEKVVDNVVVTKNELNSVDIVDS